MKEYLRNASEADRELLFAWANDREVRINSFSGGGIPWTEHVEWFRRMMEDGDTCQYIYMAEGQPAGQIRVCISEEEAEISYSICAGYRGRGHGARMLELLTERVGKELPQVKRLTARVKEKNIASRKSLQKAGYEEDWVVYEMEVRT